MKKLLYTVWDCIYPVIIYMFITTLTFMVSGLLGSVRLSVERPDFNNVLIINTIAAVILIFIWFGIIVVSKDGYKKEPVGFRALLSTEFKDYVFIGWLGISLGLCLSTLVSLFGITAQDEAFKQVNELIESQPLWIKIASAGVIIPIQEEFMYRGLIYKNIEQRYDIKKATFISSLMFGVMHMNLSQGIFAFLMGIVLAFIYQKTRNIYACIVFHCSTNLFSVLLSTKTVRSFLEEDVYLLPLVLLCMIASTFAVMLYLHKEYRRNV